MNFSRLDYISFRYCPKLSWLKKYKIQEFKMNETVQKRFGKDAQACQLARDIKILSDSYTVESVNLFDMFPQTCHVETLVLLCRN